MINIMKISIVTLSFLISACSIQAPPYDASIENVQTIKRAKVNQVNVGEITSPKKLNSISLRGSSLSSPVDKSYGAYLSKALTSELKLAKIWSGVSSTIITGEILTNDIDISSFSTGTGEISAKFIITRDGKELFNKIISAEHQFESSFMGAIAIPNAQESYIDLIQKLIKTLFEDDNFVTALKT